LKAFQFPPTPPGASRAAAPGRAAPAVGCVGVVAVEEAAQVAFPLRSDDEVADLTEDDRRAAINRFDDRLDALLDSGGKRLTGLTGPLRDLAVTSTRRAVALSPRRWYAFSILRSIHPDGAIPS
jgi:hypothetical protein